MQNERIFAHNSTNFGPNATLILHNLPISLPPINSTTYNQLGQWAMHRVIGTNIFKILKSEGKIRYVFYVCAYVHMHANCIGVVHFQPI